MVVVPTDMPVTTPPDTVPTAVLLLLHTPLPVASVKLVVAPAHKVGVPVIVPALGIGLTVTIVVALVLPQLLVTV